MKSTPKWLLIPPVVALLLVLGPMAMQQDQAKGGSADPAPAQQATARPAEDAAPRASRSGGLVPRTPDMWQVGSTMVGVILLGVGGMLALKKLRGGAAPSSRTPVASLRQTLRLSTKQAVHAIEFDDRVLLIGESDKGLTLLDHGRLPESIADEVEVTSRAAALAAQDEDDGAVPKNLVIPRPATPPARRPVTPPATQPAPKQVPGLNDFRALLQKAGR
ncbi:MAG: flagellar biosynthetic protein FliO [Planctomycetes bacterium]|nr:flagellar biosynthetic protein FliO [Planctomycetota bacterium]